MTINKERLKLGLDALRSGEYEQVRQTLVHRDSEGLKFCCLGVLTHVAIQNGVDMELVEGSSGTLGFQYNPDRGTDKEYLESSVMHPAVFRWYGFEGKFPNNPEVAWVRETEYGTGTVRETCSAAELNDFYSLGFNRIADILEDSFLKGDD